MRRKFELRWTTGRVLAATFAFVCMAASTLTGVAMGRTTASASAPTHAVLLASARRHAADRTLVRSAEQSRRCIRSNTRKHAARCAAQRKQLQRAGAALASAEHKLAAVTCGCGGSHVASSAALRGARVAPRLIVSGYSLHWTAVKRIKTYVLEQKVPGQAARYSLVRGTATTPPPVLAADVGYRVRTTADSSAWTKEQHIAYPSGEAADAQAAPALSVAGATLSWSPIARVKAYVLMSKVNGGAAQYSVISGTSVTPQAVAGASVQFSVRTAVYGSAWSATVTISYPEGSQPGGGAPSEGSPGSPSETSKSNLIVGVVSLASGPTAQVKTFKSTLHTRYMRLDAGNGASGWYSSNMPAFITEVVTKDEITPLILYNPAESGKEALVGRPVATVHSEVKALGNVMHGLGLKWMEFGNEEYFYEQPGEYAKQYMAAYEGLAGLGITLIPDCWGDYHNTEGGAGHEYWSQVSNGGGWWVDFVNDVKALGGALPAACSLHPYGPMAAHEYLGAGNGPSGWESVPAMHNWMVAKGMSVPIWITEVGGETYGNDEPESEQAFAVRNKQYVEDASHWSYVQGLFIFSALDGSEQGVGLFKTNGAPKLAATTFGETVASLGLASA